MAMLLRMLHLLPDLLELLLEHARRDLEVVRIRQLVQQGPLHSLARIAPVFLAELPADRVLQRTEILHAHPRGDRVVARRLDGLAKERKSCVSGRSVSSRVDTECRGYIKK